MEQTMGVAVAIAVGIATVAWYVLWWWNDVFYVLPVMFRFSGMGKKLPPGNMGLPFLGEMLTFLWCFKFLRQPDEYINSKRRKFGDGVGLYRTHLFGRPSIIVSSPQAIKLVLQSDQDFLQEWPSVELMGKTSLIAVHGEAHDRIRTFFMRIINKPDSLRHITIMIQPRVISALHSWAKNGRITAYDEVKKVTLDNIGKYFAGLEPGPGLDTIAKYFKGMLMGFRANPINIPGTAHYHTLKCRKKVTTIFAEEMEKRKMSRGESAKND